MNLFMLGDFKLDSCANSRWKLECDSLTDADIECLALMIRHMVGPFSSVEGVPRGGLRLAKALKVYTTDGPHLIVDDVLTTGGSMKRAAIASGQAAFIGAVVFARGMCPVWVQPLFQIHPTLWLK